MTPPVTPSGEQVELSFEGQRAVVVEVGGGLREYSVESTAVLDGYGAGELCSSGRGQLLIPWPNRIEDGSYEFDELRHQLPLDEPERRNAIHGLVRWSPWSVVEREDDRATLEHVLHPRPGYPFKIALRVSYALTDRGLTVRTTAANIGSAACPYGAGAHPYLAGPRGGVDSESLRVPARAVLETNERGLPVSVAPVDGTELDFRSARAIGSTVLDHCFTELERDGDGRARVLSASERSG